MCAHQPFQGLSWKRLGPSFYMVPIWYPKDRARAASGDRAQKSRAARVWRQEPARARKLDHAPQLRGSGARFGGRIVSTAKRAVKKDPGTGSYHNHASGLEDVKRTCPRASPSLLMPYGSCQPAVGPAYPVLVSTVDTDGNATDGLRHPVLQVPRATLLGWTYARKVSPRVTFIVPLATNFRLPILRRND